MSKEFPCTCGGNGPGWVDHYYGCKFRGDPRAIADHWLSYVKPSIDTFNWKTMQADPMFSFANHCGVAVKIIEGLLKLLEPQENRPAGK